MSGNSDCDQLMNAMMHLGGWHTLPHHPNEAVEFAGACLPQAGPILRAVVPCEGWGFRRSVTNTSRFRLFRARDIVGNYCT